MGSNVNRKPRRGSSRIRGCPQMTECHLWASNRRMRAMRALLLLVAALSACAPDAETPAPPKVPIANPKPPSSTASRPPRWNASPSSARTDSGPSASTAASSPASCPPPSPAPPSRPGPPTGDASPSPRPPTPTRTSIPAISIMSARGRRPAPGHAHARRGSRLLRRPQGRRARPRGRDRRPGPPPAAEPPRRRLRAAQAGPHRRGRELPDLPPRGGGWIKLRARSTANPCSRGASRRPSRAASPT